MRALAQLLAVTLGASWLAGCIGDDGPGTACGTGPGKVEVARGGSRLYDLPPSGGELPIVLGSQGGIHVLVGFRVWDMDLGMDITYRLVDPETEAVVGTPTALSLRPTLFTNDGTSTIRNPDLVVLNNEEPRVEDFAGRTVRLELEARSADSHACDARTARLVAPAE